MHFPGIGPGSFPPHGFPRFLGSDSKTVQRRLWIPKRCKGVHCVDLGESFPTHIYLQKSASIQPRTSPVKFARSPCTDPPGSRHTGTARSTRGLRRPALSPAAAARRSTILVSKFEHGGQRLDHGLSLPNSLRAIWDVLMRCLKMTIRKMNSNIRKADNIDMFHKNQQLLSGHKKLAALYWHLVRYVSSNWLPQLLSDKYELYLKWRLTFN